MLRTTYHVPRFHAAVGFIRGVTHAISLSFAFTVLCVVAAASAAEFQFRDQELPTRLTVGYAVRLLDMNGDQRLDIAIVDSERILWLENPELERARDPAGPDEEGQRLLCSLRHRRRRQLDFAVGADWQPANTSPAARSSGSPAATTPAGQWTLSSDRREIRPRTA